MSEPRRVLAVDEQRATLAFLRSVLPLVEGERFEIFRALSAEEALLELRHRPYDLLITGFRLPGMDGLELSRRARRLRPELGIILATARRVDEMSAPAAAAGVDHLLHKPVDAEAFRAAVRASLPAESPSAARSRQAHTSDQAVALPSAVIRRLEVLGDETGAGQVVLATVTGEVLHATGRSLHRDAHNLVAAASIGVRRALDLAAHLNEAEPKAVQYVEGTATDLCWANVGQDFFVAILFDARLRRGRIGTVWVFAQRTVDQLTGLLANRPHGQPDSPVASAARPGPQISDARDDAEAEASGPVAEQPPADSGPGPEAPGREDADASPPDGDAGPDPVEAEEPARSADEERLDAFWEEALAADSGDDAFGAGISLAEAKARGLVAEDFSPEGWGEDGGD